MHLGSSASKFRLERGERQAINGWWQSQRHDLCSSHAVHESTSGMSGTSEHGKQGSDEESLQPQSPTARACFIHAYEQSSVFSHPSPLTELSLPSHGDGRQAAVTLGTPPKHQLRDRKSSSNVAIDAVHVPFPLSPFASGK